MTLRRRLLLALAGLALTLTVVGASVLVLQRQYLLGQIDDEVVALASGPRVVKGLTLAAGRDLPDLLSEVYVGRFTRAGALVAVVAPSSDPALVPDVSATELLATPVERPTVSGRSARVRVVTTDLANGTRVVVAKSTASAEAAVVRLARTLALGALAVAVVVGLVLWWVVRLGLRPIAAMTETADAIAAGSTTRRVAPGAPGTEAARLGAAINTMLDSTAAAQDRLRRFVADASHELRTPLTTLQGYSALHLTGGPRTADQTDDAMRRIQGEATRMSRIVADLLSLTDLDSGGIAPTEQVDLPGLLGDVVSDVRAVQPGRRVELVASEGLVVTGDRDRILQAVTALTSNAVRHTPEEAAVTVRATRQGERWVRVEVSDTGIGIAAEHLPHLFERFYRVDRSRSRAQGGTGLGLAIVAAIATAHGGRYGVQSAPGAGATFWLELPGGAGSGAPERNSNAPGRAPGASLG